MADVYLNGPGSDVAGDIYLFGPHPATTDGGGRRRRIELRSLTTRSRLRLSAPMVRQSRTSSGATVLLTAAAASMSSGHNRSTAVHVTSVDARSSVGASALCRAIPVPAPSDPDWLWAVLTEGT